MRKKPLFLTIKRRLVKCFKFSNDLLFPQFCVGCNTEGFLVCKKCKDKVVLISSQCCPECGRLSKQGRYCQRCQKEKFLEAVLVTSYYEEGPIKEAIHNFKYDGALELKSFLSQLMTKVFLKEDLKTDLITFAPLHRFRLASRGYNQSEILALQVGKKTKIPIKELLIKVKNTKRQVGLTGVRRRANLSGVFKVKRGVDIKGKNILIIDDILTTGTTLNECAKVLKENGANEVWGMVVAKG